MRYGTYFPALAGCFALMLLAATASRTVGQGRITDESTPTVPVTVETPSTTVTVKSGDAKVVMPDAEAAPTEGAPATPAEPKIDVSTVLAELSRLETQADQALANQQKIDVSLKELSETIEQARIYAARAGKGAVKK